MEAEAFCCFEGIVEHCAEHVNVGGVILFEEFFESKELIKESRENVRICQNLSLRILIYCGAHLQSMINLGLITLSPPT